MKSEKIERGKVFDLDADEVEECLIDYIEKKSGERIPEKEEVDVSILNEDEHAYIEGARVVVTKKKRE